MAVLLFAPHARAFVRGRRRVLLSVLCGRRLATAPSALVAVHPTGSGTERRPAQRRLRAKLVGELGRVM